MFTHHVDIYHCQTCGRVKSCEHEAGNPMCCGKRMARAVANITYEDESDEVPPPDEVITRSHCLEAAKRK